jgi:hypothetical protein
MAAMFDSFIIERIRQEEENRRRGEDRPRLDVPEPPPGYEPAERFDDTDDRGVIVIGEDDEE